MFKVHTGFQDSISQLRFWQYGSRHLSWQIKTAIEEIRSLKAGKEDGELQKVYNRIIADGPRSELDSAIVQYVQGPINTDGFRSIAFRNYKGAVKVLFIGDSFTWGHSAKKIGNSFADILLARGFAVFNTGVSGADPSQYLAIARQYIPALKPDVVVVNFFMGNDVMYDYRPVKAGFPILYETNAGSLYSYYEGREFSSAQQAYDFARHTVAIPANTGFNRMCSYTALSSLLWSALYKNGFIHPVFEGDVGAPANHEHSVPFSNAQIDSIQTLAVENGARFKLVVIPMVMNDSLERPSTVFGLLNTTPYIVSPVGRQDYDPADGHFTSHGHALYAHFLEGLLKQ